MSSMSKVGEYENESNNDDASLRKLARRDTQSLNGENSNDQENIPSLDKNHNKKIPNLKYAKQNNNKNNGFKNQFMTPVTFVSKDQQMRADYHIDSDVEEMFMPGEGTKILNYHNLKRIEGNEQQPG